MGMLENNRDDVARMAKVNDGDPSLRWRLTVFLFAVVVGLLSRELGFWSLSADDRTKDFRLFGRGGEGVAL
jgi:hypothetical protein